MSVTGRSRETIILGDLAQRVSTGRRAEDPRPRLAERSDQSEGTIRLLYHGSCSRCHHFHRHVAFDVQVDHTYHTRFHCERCHHPMFGLGRTDTQISLASQDSFPMNDGVLDCAPAAVSCSNNREPPLSLQLRTLTNPPPAPEQLSAIPEQSALGQSRSTPATSAPPPNDLTRVLPAEPRTTLGGLSAVEILPGPQDLKRLTRETKPRPTFISSWVCKVVDKLARRIDNKPHEVKVRGLRLHYQFTSDHLREHQHSCLATALPSVDELPIVNAHEPRQDNSRLLGAGALSTEPMEERDGSLLCGERNGSSADPTCQAHTIDEFVTNGHTALKEERLRTARRDKTLRTRALQKKCNCTEACHCKVGGIEPSISDSTRHMNYGSIVRSATSGSFQWFPAYPLGDSVRRSSTSSESNALQTGARPDPLTHVGGVHFSRWRPSNAANSTTMVDSSGGRGQASAAASNTSSVSLHPSRPVLPRRSLSASLLPFAPPSIGHDFGTREVFRSLDFLHRARAVAAGSDFLPWRRSGSFPRRLEYDWAVEPDASSTEVHPPSLGTLSTDTVNYPLAQESQPQIDGLGASSSSSSLVHDSAR